jgi:dihydroneopterin aldolase
MNNKMKSKIAIEGMAFYAYHGFYEEEQKIGGKYFVDVYLQYDSADSWLSDDLSQTINYEMIYQLVKTEMDIPTKLIETLCRRIFDKVKEKSEITIGKSVFVSIKVTKNNPPVNGLSNVFVELEG